ncbi:MAG TPA: hypothetical protein VE961_07065 [Pyrinomonadaceae bacterium]|nr:hypothetical protein [Pyrinomonadaceae bacterium]
MPLNDASIKLIVDFEVGGGEKYYNQQGLDHPIWPQEESGVTIGVGYDLGYNSPEEISSEWAPQIPDADLQRLLACAGKKGPAAHAALPAVKSISIPWAAAFEVYEAVTIPKTTDQTRAAFPGFDDLDPNCQGALVSLVFNRGASMKGDRRIEMRAIRDLVPQKDYEGIAQQILNMKRLWKGTSIENGMNRRRDAEAALVRQSQA